MNLRIWLMKNRITQIKLAEFLGITTQYMNLICLNKIIPSIHIARKIEEFTKGEISQEEIIFPDKYPIGVKK